MSVDDAIEYVTKMSPRAGDFIVFRCTDELSPRDIRGLKQDILALRGHHPNVEFLITTGPVEAVLLDDAQARKLYQQLQQRFKTEML